jgi:hypothetical protein
MTGKELLQVKLGYCGFFALGKKTEQPGPPFYIAEYSPSMHGMLIWYTTPSGRPDRHIIVGTIRQCFAGSRTTVLLRIIYQSAFPLTGPPFSPTATRHQLQCQFVELNFLHSR